jgi:AhpD family alkylhydroperoxidase
MNDRPNRTKFERFAELTPQPFRTFAAFDAAAYEAGAILHKYKELMAIAALTPRCPCRIDIHAGNARPARATEQEIAQTTLVAAAIRASGAMIHGMHDRITAAVHLGGPK